MLCCFGKPDEAAEGPRASKYAAKENHASPTEPSLPTATATEITRKESSTNNDGATSRAASASWNPMAEVKQMLGTMKSGSHSNGIGEEELTLLEPIGKGGFGTVYKGKWRNLEVAVKMVVFAQFGPGGVANDKRAITEAAVCSSVIHSNVTATYHYDIRPVQNTENKDKPNQEEWKLTLVQELCHASLADALVSFLMHNKQNQQPNMVILLWTLADIAKGMSYIHSKGIIHGDLKPENVLLKHDPNSPIGMTAKITDFGLCSTLDASKTHISGFNTGTPFYSAPEIATTYKATPFSDVYSFGILMIEVYRNVPPWVRTPNGFRPNKAFMQFPQDSPRPYVQLAQQCLSKEAKNRPNFVEVLYRCEEMYTCLLEGWGGLERQEVKSNIGSVDQQQAALDEVGPQNGSRPLTEEILQSVRQVERRVSQSAIEIEDPPSKDST